MNIKNIIKGLLVILFSFTLTSCFFNNQSDAPTSESENKKVEPRLPDIKDIYMEGGNNNTKPVLNEDKANRELKKPSPSLTQPKDQTLSENDRNDMFNLDNTTTKKAEDVTGIKSIPKASNDAIKKGKGTTIKVTESNDLSSDFKR